VCYASLVNTKDMFVTIILIFQTLTGYFLHKTHLPPGKNQKTLDVISILCQTEQNLGIFVGCNAKHTQNTREWFLNM